MDPLAHGADLVAGRSVHGTEDPGQDRPEPVETEPRVHQRRHADRHIRVASGFRLAVWQNCEIGEHTLCCFRPVRSCRFEDGAELIATTPNVLVPRRGRDRDCRAHTNVYGRNQLPASDRGRGHRAPHNMAHSPDTFSELSLLRRRR